MSFNPRTRVGCDEIDFLRSPLRTRFNPRTRVGCDGQKPNGVDGMKSFNPRTRVGCDLRVYRRYLLRISFQSTHPRGVRLVFLS